jgi:spore coat-associated protein N
MSSHDQNRSRKILIPLATMSVAAAVVIGSGATWTSTSHSSITAA